MKESAQEAHKQRHVVQLKYPERVLVGLMLFELIARVLVAAYQIRIVIVVVETVRIVFRVFRVEQILLLLLQLLQVVQLIHRVLLGEKLQAAAEEHTHHYEYVYEDGVGVRFDFVGLLNETILTELVAYEKVEQDGGQLGEETIE